MQLTPLQRTVNAPRSTRCSVGSERSPTFADRVALSGTTAMGRRDGSRYRRCRSAPRHVRRWSGANASRAPQALRLAASRSSAICARAT